MSAAVVETLHELLTRGVVEAVGVVDEVAVAKHPVDIGPGFVSRVGTRNGKTVWVQKNARTKPSREECRT